MPFTAGCGLEAQWELDQSEITPLVNARTVSKQHITTVVFHRDTCAHEVHFVIPPQMRARVLIKQVRLIAEKLGRSSDVHVRVCGDYRSAMALHSAMRACTWLSAVLQQYIHSPLCLSTHSAFDHAVGRGTPEECPGHKFYLALRHIKDAGISVPVIK